jgi:putative endonuclease
VRKSSPRASRRSGAQAESRAAWRYRLLGYRVLERNAWAGGYELDLVLRRGRTVVFCEVKSKGGEGRGDPLEMVTSEKQRRLRQAAEVWLAAHPEHAECAARFDVVTESGKIVGRVENAF